ncbi:thioredoxin fold domain-containing protein [Tamlana sp. 2_MG-2023]|uniref:thioredoxin family protein n=1 Tax=unclassified Tamlana TaxID=2614803 RepID=UPI0026E43803|nr:MULTISPECIES: thioredoxin fold domain-containing protein [unclassified Tamlana]MDO6761615.1 thioredoxin fold domain-containing protein [Tamlana sp. 2_MG-2023]MDO6792413.1 thioredoxin fold domain-containing protein [Tamlana sp. 1_MG-2023]
MKKIVLFTLVIGLISFKAVAQEVNWISLSEALELQKKTPKKIMMDVYTNWCGPCKMLDKNTFQNSDVAAYVNENYYAVKFNAEGNAKVDYKGKTFSNPKYDPKLASRRNSAHELTRYLQVSAYPTVVFFDEKSDVIAPIRGYQTPEQLELYLKMFYKDDHKNITTQEQFAEYYKTFKSEFKS